MLFLLTILLSFMLLDVGSSCSKIRQASAGGSSISTEEGSAGSSQHGPNTCGKRKLSDRGKVQVSRISGIPTSSLCFA